MAALMHRVFRLSCIRCDFPKNALRKDVLAHSFRPKYMSTNSISSKGSDALRKDGVNAVRASPSQIVSSDEKAINLQESDGTSVSTSSTAKETGLSFATLFRQSNFVHLGNAKGKVVIGKIFRVVGDDLYVDFGWKFPCVVKKPTEDAHLFVNQATVRLRIIDLEMSTIFLGATKETSLNEANCVLLGLNSSPLGRPKQSP